MLMLAVLLPLLMLGVVVALGRYEEHMLSPRQQLPSAPAEDRGRAREPG